MRGRGWKPNVVPFEHTFSGKHRLSRAASPPDCSDLSLFTPPVMDQGSGGQGTGSCTGHATSDGSFTSFGKAGKPLPFVPSQRLLYCGGRSEERSRLGLPPSMALDDVGAYPSDVMRYVSQIGLSPMGEKEGGRFSDVSVLNVNDELDLASIEASHKAQSHSIFQGANVAGDVCAALVEYACPTGFFVDSAFENWDVLRDGFVGAPRNPNDPNGGGHYVDIVGFARAGLIAQQPKLYLPQRIILSLGAETLSVIANAAAALPAYDPVFFVKNSWGPWGLYGYFLATRAWLEAPQTGDVNAMLPVLSEDT